MKSKNNKNENKLTKPREKKCMKAVPKCFLLQRVPQKKGQRNCGKGEGVCLSQGSWNQKVFNVTATQLFAYGGQKNVAKICKHVPRGASQPVVGFLHNLCLFMWSRSLEPTATATADRRLTTSHNP